MNFIRLFKQSVSRFPYRAAYVDLNGERRTSYADLDILSGRVAGKLHRLGLPRGSFVLVNMDRRMEYMAAYLGILKAGCAVVPVVPEYPQERIDFIRSNCDSKLTITEDFFDDINDFEIFEEPSDGAEPAWLTYTSGSTGVPKGILHNAADQCRHVVRHQPLLDGVDPLVIPATAPFSFTSHIFENLTALYLGGTIHIIPEGIRRSAEALAEYYRKNDITVVWLVPQMLRVFMDVRKPGDSLQRVIAGGERMSRIFSDTLDVVNTYGLSETGGIVTMFLLDRSYDNTPIGKAVGGLEIVICDDNGHVVPDGTVGEIVIRGDLDGVYFKDPIRTRRIMPKSDDGRMMLHTGDNGYVNENGDIVYVSRRDWMVKINGQRVETGEIEILMNAIDGIHSAAVKGFVDEDGQTYIAAFYDLDSPVSEDFLRKKLGEKLPAYMIPRFFVEMDVLPKNANGKIDRSALAAPDTERYKTDYAAPSNDGERAVCRAFESVLHCGRVGINDDFFALGGDSIKVLRLVEAAALPGLTPEKILAGRTPAAIAALCTEAPASAIVHADEIPEVTPLTEAQEGVYLECAEAPDSVMYNIPMLCRLPKGVNSARFIEAVKTVASAHKALCVTVGMREVPSMIYCDREIMVEEKDVDSIEQESRDFVKPFDLENGPLYRFELCHEKNGASAFLFDIHHIIFDGTSSEAFVSQIAKVYNGGEMTEEALTVFDLSAAEKNIKAAAEYKAAQEYFLSRFDGIDCDSRIIPDVVVDEEISGAGRIVLRADNKFSGHDVLSFTKKHKITENTLFLGAFAYALAKFNGTAESVFCTVNNGRHDPRLAGSVGMFVKTLPLYFNLDEKAAVSEYLPAVQQDLFNAMSHDCISFGELAAQYGVSTDTVFVYQAEIFNGAELNIGEMKVEMLETGDCQSDLDVMLIKTADGYELMAHYRKALYSEALIHSFAELYLNIVRGMLTADTLGDIPMTDESFVSALDRINATESGYDDTVTVVDLFRAQAKKTPDNICLVFRDKRFTYREVDELTDRLAKYLVNNGVGREKVVGILIPRCEYMLLASLGVLKAGGAYLPLDPSYPPERLNLMVQDSGAMMLIYDPALDGVISSDFSGIRMSADVIPSLADCDVELPVPAPHDMFVMLYTSGSTGTPKGVMFEHSNTLVTAVWVKKFYDINETSRVTSYASYGFDAHTYDIYPAIISGAQLHIIAEDIRLDLLAVRQYFNDNGITHSVMTTQVGRQFALLGGCDTLRHLSVGGEKLTPIDPPENFSLHNVYGPTEGSVITSEFCLDRRYKDVPIGKAVDDLKLYVVDKNGKLLPFGGVGELWIAGPHVTRGYLNRPEKNAEAYGDNPFCTEKGYERVYRTGDIVRLNADGNLQFVGRRDAQVKVRGFRVELTEIEEVIRRFPGIKDATVAAFDDPAGGKFVAGYVVSDEKVSFEALADFIRGEKPPYMVPAVFMQIDAIPLNQNQKVNKRALPVPQRELGQVTPPENDIQQKIFDIIAEVIGHRDFGIDTNIYDAGLTSIGAVKLNVALAEAFGAAIRIADIKANDTVKALEKFLAAAAPQTTYAVQTDYPITETQSGIFVECLAAPDTTIYNMPALIRIGAGVDPEKLAAAVKTAVDAHPYVKTTLFTDTEGNCRAARHDDAEVPVGIVKCSTLPTMAELIRPFALLDSPLYRITIYVTDYGNYLFMDFHHIISDGTSETILFRDIDRAYAGEILKKEHFTGFEAALEEEKVRKGARYDASKAYWNTLLAGCETSCLPKSDPDFDHDGSGSIKLFGNDASAIDKFCQGNNVSLNAFFNSAFAFTMSRFAGKDNLTYTTVFNGRNDSRLAESVMLLARTVPVIAEIKPDFSVVDTVSEMQSQLMSSMTNDACSFAELSHRYGVKADMMLVYQGDSFLFDSLCGEKAEMLDVSLDTAKAPISVSIYRKGGRYEYDIDFRRENYREDFAVCFGEALMEAVSSFTENKLIKDVSILTEHGLALYDKLNDSDLDTEKEVWVHQFVERHAAASPHAPAVTSEGRTFTYGELNARANIIAHELVRAGIGRENIVGVVLDRCCELPTVQIAILKAGGAFMAALPSYPDDRIEYCLANADSPCVITSEKIKAARPALFADDKPYKTFTVEKLLQGTETGNLNTDILPEQLAYCIYTSGSTGNPKGVMIEHHNMTNAIQANWKLAPDYYRSDSTGAALATCSVSFDASILDIYMPLCAGRHLILCTEDEHHDPMALRDLMLTHNVQFMLSTPSFMSNLVSMPQLSAAVSQLRGIIVGAEVFPASLYEALRACNPAMQIVNGYGPSECAICSSAKEILDPRRITIGKSIGNYKQFVLDRFGHILPPYAVGELVICGEGVGRGYVKLPEKTAAAFFRFKELPAYHSGDLVRLNGDGEIDFGGRMDNQIKLRGFRIELDEIEKVMCDYGSVKQSKVIVRNNGTEDYLAGFYTAAETVEPEQLSAYMKSRLTYYMVPAVLMQLEQMPLTPNGKIDKKGFPEVQQTGRKTGRKAPKKSLEQRLCEIFSTTLKVDEVFADDNFFELGGTSLTASKVTMVLMSEGIEVKYGDIFDNPTPEALADFIEERDRSAKKEETVKLKDEEKTRPALQYNVPKYAHEVKREGLGNVLLTGTTGFLGIHVLSELLKIENGHIWCLVRKGGHESMEVRLKALLIYYFSNAYEDAFRDRITLIDADITDKALDEVLADVPFDTVINCAACVKHFSDSNILEEINVDGVKNLISICQKRHAKLIQISTTSVPGVHTAESYEKQVRMHENELFVIDDMDNKYTISKYHAELLMLDAIEGGMRGKIIRVGNLMGRHSDGEFQANLETNMFLSGIRGFATLGKYPISHMTDPMRFSPIDYTARAVVLLAGTNDKFTAFHADNRYGFDEMKIIDACNRNGITILPTADEDYYAEYNRKLGDDRINSRLNGLAAYDIRDAHAVDTDNLFTTNILYRIGFSWPLVDQAYLDRAIHSIMTLDYFGLDELSDLDDNE